MVILMSSWDQPLHALHYSFLVVCYNITPGIIVLYQDPASWSEAADQPSHPWPQCSLTECFVCPPRHPHYCEVTSQSHSRLCWPARSVARSVLTSALQPPPTAPDQLTVSLRTQATIIQTPGSCLFRLYVVGPNNFYFFRIFFFSVYINWHFF